MPIDANTNPAIAALVTACRAFLARSAEDDVPVWLGKLSAVELLDAAEQHGLISVLHSVADRGPWTQVFVGAERDALDRRFRAIAAGNLVATSELLGALETLREHGIDALAFKGPALALQLYGDTAMRRYGDVDLLVRPADIRGAVHVLSKGGFSSELELSPGHVDDYLHFGCEWPFISNRSGALIELHWSLFARYLSFPFDIDDVFRNSVNLRIADKDIRTIGREHLALLLCAHGTKHFWYRLSWLLDAALLLSQVTESQCVSLLSAATALGLRRILLLTCVLVNDMLAPDLPETLLLAASRDRIIVELAQRIQKQLGNALPALDPLTENVLLLRARERWSDRARMIARLALTPGFAEWQTIKLGRFGRLYPLVRLARASRYVPKLLRRLASSPE